LSLAEQATSISNADMVMRKKGCLGKIIVGDGRWNRGWREM